MNTKPNTKRITDFLDAIDWLFQVQNFERELIIKDRGCEDEENSTAADISFNERYQMMTISIYPCFFKETLERQRKMLLHELIHTITLPLKTATYGLLDGKFITKDEVDKLNERETSQFENILDALLQGKKHYAKDAYNNYLKENGKKPRRLHKKSNKTNK
jgi:hypothetical protein